MERLERFCPPVRVLRPPVGLSQPMASPISRSYARSSSSASAGEDDRVCRTDALGGQLEQQQGMQINLQSNDAHAILALAEVVAAFFRPLSRTKALARLDCHA